MSNLENVSRETFLQIEAYEALILKWSASINLVAKSALKDLRDRHIEDSAALFPLIPITTTQITDIGSGGGLPGIVLALIAKEKLPNTKFTLIESDQRKAAFLRAASIQLELGIDVVSQRIEASTPSNADLVTARALAPLPKLLGYVSRHLKTDGVALLPKGKNHAQEVALAREVWDFVLEVFPDNNEPDAAILKVTSLKEKNAYGT